MGTSYFKVGIGDEVPHWIYHKVRGDRHWQQLDVDGPAPLGDRFPVLTIECEYARPLPDLFESGSKPIVSEKFRLICKSFEVPAEFLPINIQGPQGATVADQPYWFLHVTERLDCIDYDKSVYMPWSARPGSEFRRIRKLVLRQKVIGTRDVLKPYRHSQLYASDRLRTALIDAQCSVLFTPLDEVRLGVMP